MVNKLKYPIGFYLASIIIILYTWRLVPFGNFFNVFLFISLIIGLKNNFFKFLKLRKIPVWLFYILLGILISIIFNVYSIGSFSALYKSNSEYTSLRYKSIIEGIGLFIILIININSKKGFEKFIKIFTHFGIFTLIIWILGISEPLINILGFERYDELFQLTTSNYSMTRETFETLDENTFGSICCLLFLFCSHFILFSKKKIIYIIGALLILYSIFLTVSRTISVRLIFQTLIYLSFTGKLKIKNIIVFFIVSLPFIFIFYINNPLEIILYRFTESYYNIIEWRETGILTSRDSFQYRLVRSLLGVPETFSGWIFGSGGVQTARFGKSADHIEYTNWLWQYGLITFIPLILFLLSIIKKSLTIINRKNSKEIKSILASNMAIISGMMISMIANPQFYYLWITLSITSLTIYIYDEKKSIT